MIGRIAMGAGAALALGFGAAAAQTGTELDTDGDGTITVEDVLSYGEDMPEGQSVFESVYEFDVTGGVTAEEYAQLERGRLDADADGTIDEEEFAAWMEATGGSASAAAADAASSGEAASGGVSDTDAAATSGANEFDARFQELFASLDTDEDGELSREEFLRAEFERFDADGDGELSQEELDRMTEAVSQE